MKNYIYSMLVCCLLTLSGCQIIGAIFKAGVWVGILIVVVVVALIIWLISKGMNRD
ncbi:hypothetical protein CLV59_104539 [Chitinophaga dinghuensis]|uniref:Phosphatidate cytidylyltransferase n=1 Tax=Chitinophaga dinghuensis TaxID=1539050 RepID=A0A327W0Y2_9BACT|nr:phosphatidate cytidylyltransferase [Chitinophaga dinghuensis]RAJ82313.1 hypothetical protein CLV59_104539 [Chitinophaga dinghuensis]